MKLTESCRAGGKFTYEEYLQKIYQYSLFQSNLSLFNVKIL